MSTQSAVGPCFTRALTQTNAIMISATVFVRMTKHESVEAIIAIYSLISRQSSINLMKGSIAHGSSSLFAYSVISSLTAHSIVPILSARRQSSSVFKELIGREQCVSLYDTIA